MRNIRTQNVSVTAAQEYYSMCLDKDYDSGVYEIWQNSLVIHLMPVRVAKKHKLLNKKLVLKLTAGFL